MTTIPEEDNVQQHAYYEDDTTLAQYLEFNYGEQWHGEPNFPKELADAALDTYHQTLMNVQDPPTPGDLRGVEQARREAAAQLNNYLRSVYYEHPPEAP